MPVQTLDSRARRARHWARDVDVTEILQVDIASREITVRDAAGPRTIPVREGFFMRAIPRPGDCLITYADGHMSHARTWPKAIANSNAAPSSTQTGHAASV
ncbi:hypothetical protein VQ042_09015 [Aurantimonas sp. A2-1-M11]|uniref:hypothetical protein n=1 Tax=Aurantimonas sp. A2-1-M11 TaxID=3113712 RepID=UPI002F94203F